jgi:hypothetical protein
MATSKKDDSKKDKKVKPEKKPDKGSKFLSIVGSKVKDTASVVMAPVANKAEDLRVGIKDRIGEGVTENDVKRRIEKFRLILSVHANDERFKEAISKGEALSAGFDRFRATSAKGQSTPDWVALYKLVGDSTATLEADLDRLQNSEAKGLEFAADNDKLTEQTLNNIEGLLATANLAVTQRDAFLKSFTATRKLVLEVGTAQGSDQLKKLEAADRAATELLLNVQASVKINNNQAKPLLVDHERLGNLLAGVSDEKTQERVKVSALLRQAKDDIGLCEYKKAREALAAADAELKKTGAKAPDSAAKLKTRMDELTRAWNGYTSPLETAIAQAKKTQPGYVETEDVAGLRQRAADLRARWNLNSNAINFMLSEPGSEAQVSRMLDDAEKDRQHARQLIEQAAGLVPGQTPVVRADFVEQIAEVNRQLDALRQAAADLYKSVAGGAQPEELIAEIDELRARWVSTHRKAALPEDLAIAEYVREIEGLDRIVKARVALIAKGALKPVDVAFEVQVKKFHDTFAALTTSANAALAADYKVAITKGLAGKPAMKKMAADTLIAAQEKARGTDEEVKKRTDLLVAINAEMTALKIEADKIKPVDASLLEMRRTQCEAVAKEIRSKILALLEYVANKSRVTMWSDEKAGYSDYAKALQAEVALALSPVKAKDMVVLNDVFTDLRAVEARVGVFEKLVKKAEGAPPGFDTIKKGAIELQTQLADALFATRAEVIKPLKDAVDEIANNATQLDPADSTSKLADLKQKIADAKARAGQEHAAMKLKRAEIKALAADIDKQGVQQLKILGAKYGSYLDNLLFRIDQFKQRFTAADKFDQADGDLLKALQTEWKNALDVMLTNGLGKDESKKQRDEKIAFLDRSMKSVDEEAAKVAAAEKRLIELREVQLKVLKHIADGDSLDKAERENLKKQIGMASDQIATGLENLKTRRDSESANALAESLTMRLQRMQDAPMGSGTNARNNLPVVVGQWKQVVQTMHERIGSLHEQVLGQCESDAEKAAAQRLIPLQAELQALFVKDAFDGVVKRMTDGKPAAKDIAAAKEDGLREVRRIEAFIAKHPRLKLVTGRAYPFEKPDLPVTAVGAALFNLKTNLMTSG